MTPVNGIHRRPLLLLSMLLPLVLAACGGGAPEQGQFPPQDVSVSTVVQRDIVNWKEYSGRIQAVQTIQIRPRVTGYLAGVHFREGSLVNKGDLLFSIDDREYRAAVAAADADVARAAARVLLAMEELKRSQSLIEAKAVSQGELDARSAELRQAEADHLAAKARLDQARLNLDFTEVRAPIAGRIGAAEVKPGNLVSPGEPVLSTLVSVDPVHVTFDGDERAWLQYQARNQGQRKDNPVTVALSDDPEFKYQGQLDFVDNSLNPQTGTIRARALLPNPDGRLTPGLFARVRLLGEQSEKAMLVHEQAVMTDQDRKYVWAVDDKGLATRHDVVLGDTFEGLRIVKSGLSAGDRVVVNGVRKIFFPGQPLKPRDVPMSDPNQPAPAAPAAAAPQAGG